MDAVTGCASLDFTSHHVLINFLLYLPFPNLTVNDRDYTGPFDVSVRFTACQCLGRRFCFGVSGLDAAARVSANIDWTLPYPHGDNQFWVEVVISCRFRSKLTEDDG